MKKNKSAIIMKWWVKKAWLASSQFIYLLFVTREDAPTQCLQINMNANKSKYSRLKSMWTRALRWSFLRTKLGGKKRNSEKRQDNKTTSSMFSTNHVVSSTLWSSFRVRRLRTRLLTGHDAVPLHHLHSLNKRNVRRYVRVAEKR